MSFLGVDTTVEDPAIIVARLLLNGNAADPRPTLDEELQALDNITRLAGAIVPIPIEELIRAIINSLNDDLEFCRDVREIPRAQAAWAQIKHLAKVGDWRALQHEILMAPIIISEYRPIRHLVKIIAIRLVGITTLSNVVTRLR